MNFSAARKYPEPSLLPLLLLSPPRKKHTFFGELEIPFFDEEFGLAQSPAHAKEVTILAQAMKTCLDKDKMHLLIDNPIYGYEPESDVEKITFPDLAFLSGKTTIRGSETAKDMLTVLEVVSTSKLAIEEKDTVRNLYYYAYNRVPEYVLIFPEIKDKRVIIWYELNKGRYVKKDPDTDGIYRSKMVPSFSARPLPKNKWANRNKLEYFCNGEQILDARPGHIDRLKQRQFLALEKRKSQKESNAKVKALKQADQERAEKEKERAEKQDAIKLAALERAEKEKECAEKQDAIKQAAQERAEKEKERAEKEKERAEKEKERTEKEKERAEKEKERAEKEKERAEKERLFALLKSAGLDPDAL